VRIDFLWLFRPRANVKNLAPFFQAGGDGVAFQPRLADEDVVSRIDLPLGVWIISLRHFSFQPLPRRHRTKIGEKGKQRTKQKALAKTRYLNLASKTVPPRRRRNIRNYCSLETIVL
jgi:hypothetical protein